MRGMIKGSLNYSENCAIVAVTKNAVCNEKAITLKSKNVFFQSICVWLFAWEKEDGECKLGYLGMLASYDGVIVLYLT